MYSRKLQILIFSVLLLSLNLVQIGREKIPAPTTSTSQKTEVKIDKNKYMTATLKTDKVITISKDINFNPDDVTEISNISHDELYHMLQGTGMEDVTTTIIQSEKEYKVNALFLTSIIALESGWGQSDRAKTTNNMGGVEVYSPLSRGSIYDNREDSVLHIAQFLRQDYLNKDGKYYNGVSVWDININYCVKNDWSQDVIRIAHELLEKYNRKNN